MSEPRDLRLSLEEFLSRIDPDELAPEIAAPLQIEIPAAAKRLRTYMNEARFALGVVEPHLVRGERILEVGSGTGLFSLFLRHAGFDVTALEPVGEGYDFMGSAFEVLRRRFSDIDLPFLPIGAEALSPDRHGPFDLIFSLHVLEHLPDLERGVAAMASVLAADGRMVHACPNYAFPYDPHYAIPLVPFAPALTAKLLPRRITESGRWKSINFITAGRLERIAGHLGYGARFAPGVLADMVQRVNDDPVFADRHGGFAARSLAVARGLGLTGLLRRIPPRLASPMIVTLAAESSLR